MVCFGFWKRIKYHTACGCVAVYLVVKCTAVPVGPTSQRVQQFEVLYVTFYYFE